MKQNYDAEEFMDFCLSNAGNVDIAEWTFEQLDDVIAT